MKSIILSHKVERDRLLSETYVPRNGLETARQSMQNNLVKVIIGPRRAGKSVFAIQLLKELDFAYVNFDDERLIGTYDYDELIKAVTEVYGETKYILFDEIQNISNWELFVNRLHRQGFNIVLTGSNSKLLSRELATHLTGRYIQFWIFPFSFSEFLRARDFVVDETLELKERQGLLLNHLNEYLDVGGFPEVVVKNADSRNYLATLFESVLFKDVVKRYNLRYSKKLYDLSLYLITNHSTAFSYTRLKNLLGFRSVHTLENYIEYLKEAFLVFSVGRYSHKLRQQIKSPRKIYSYDPGTINVIKFKTTPDTGKLLENLAAIELLRRGKEFYYYRTTNGKEVDFAVKEGLRVEQLIQVCFDLSDYQTRKRETSAFIKASKEVSCGNLIVLTWDDERSEVVNGKEVIFMPLWKWLIAS